MANITAASILYGEPLKCKVGDLLFSATQIEVASTATEYVEGGIEILPEKLGLTDEAISGANSAAREAGIGKTASTTALPGYIWCSGWLMLAKDANEAQKEITAEKVFPCAVTLVKQVPYLRVFAPVAAGQEKGFDEIKVKQSLSLCATTIFALGK